MIQMQLVDTVHQSEIGVGYRSWSRIDTATANPQNFSLLGEEECMSMVNHRFALSNPALVCAPSKKYFQGEFTNFGVQRFHISGRFIE